MNEQRIENELIEKLEGLKYTRREDIRDRATLHANFRKHFEALNQVNLTDGEFDRLLEKIITPDVFTASKILREISTFERDDGTPLHFMLVNIRDWCKNTFEVVKQLRINTDNSHHRYDVILLINGVPVVQIELKTLAISPRRAMQQIVDYKNDAGNGYSKTLMCFMQMFIVSNQSDTWYFANNNARHFTFDADERFLPFYQFADKDNTKIVHLHDFADHFLAKCTLGQMISKYMVLVASEQKLLMMRPYQIYAVKAIVDCIQQNCGNGYIWHTTGSGKTLTSFKASTLLKDNKDIEKCIFVVDRKDLDRQTREEFNRFQEGSVEENANRQVLMNRLVSDTAADKVIVTTIQKLGLILSDDGYKERLQGLKDKRVVFIFDECHRSQFGDYHKYIKEFFPRAQLFGFTGTPIFEKNAIYKKVEGEEASYKTTEDIFERELHAYTITNAIDDRNVLKFHVDHFKPEGKRPPKAGDPLAKKAVVAAILEKHDAATAGRKFNSILATASIPDAVEYWELFQSNERKLNVACVFSPPNEKQIQEDLAQEQEDNKVEPEKKKAALEKIIAAYNAQYGTNHSLSGLDGFDLYYKDVQKRIKDQQYPNADFPHENKIDIIIVVDMLLTGFDSKFLNTLYVDKNLKYHGLIQAFSRTNRVLNDTKPYGNILDFRQQKDAVDEAIALFSGGKVEQARKVWLVEQAPVVIDKLGAAVKKLNDFMTSQGLSPTASNVANLKGNAARAQFVNAFKEVQRLKTQLDQYTDLTDDDRKAIESTIAADDLQAFKGVYIEVAKRLKSEQEGPRPDAEVEQLDFEFVLFASAVIDYDYIMKLIANYSGAPAGKEKISREALIGLIRADSKFMDEQEEIEEYIATLKVGKELDVEEIKKGFDAFKSQKYARALTEMAAAHGLDAQALQEFTDTTMKRMVFDGDDFSALFEAQDLGWKEQMAKEAAMMQSFKPFLQKLAKGRDISGLRAYDE